MPEVRHPAMKINSGVLAGTREMMSLGKGPHPVAVYSG